MFRPVPDDIDTSIYADKPFTIVELPYDRIDHTKYKGRLRDLSRQVGPDQVVQE